MVVLEESIYSYPIMMVSIFNHKTKKFYKNSNFPQFQQMIKKGRRKTVATVNSQKDGLNF